MFDYLLTEEQQKLQQEARDFAKSVDRQLLLDMDADKVWYPKGYLEEAARRHLLGLRFPQKYGGRGLGWAEEIVALQEIGTLGTSLGCLYSLVSIVGEAINQFGTEEQKEKYLKPTLEGKIATAEGLTEPRGGSDFFGATTQAEKKGDKYILNGQKRFIVGAEGADYFMVYARTDPQASPHKGISAFLVDRGPGIEVKHVYGLMGTRGGGTGRVVFKEVEVPPENLLGKLNGAAEIFYQMMVPERMTSAGGALGMARSSLEVATRYSTRRKAFGYNIKNFQGVNFKISESLTMLDAAKSLVFNTAQAIDRGIEPSLQRRLVSESKKKATDTAWEVVNHAMQILGGIGYTSIYPLERMLRDVRLTTIWTGTNEIMNLIIQHEFFKEFASTYAPGRDIEQDAAEAEYEEEKVYE